MKTQRRTSLSGVLVWSIGGVAVGAVVLTALVTVGLTRLNAPQRALTDLASEASRLASTAPSLPCAEGQRPVAAVRELGANARFVPDGVVRRRLQSLGTTGRARIAGRNVLYASAPTTLCGRAGTLYVFRPVSDVPFLPSGFGRRLILAGLIALAVSALVAFGVSRRLAKPLRDLAGSVRAFSKGDHVAPAPSLSDPAEVAELKEAFGGMMSDLDASRDREKAFLLSVSHELRTPLTAIRGYAEALADGTARQSKRTGEVVLNESKRLERLVGDLIDLGRIEAGEFSVHTRDADLNDVATAVVNALRPAAKEHDVALAFKKNAAAQVRTDPDRVHQMVANLVENAIRVSPPGSEVRVEVDTGVIAVADTGPGLDPADIDHAFERFYLWRKYRGARPVGSGLGLAIVGELARRLGVDVSVSSADGTGSRFEIRFGRP